MMQQPPRRTVGASPLLFLHAFLILCLCSFTAVADDNTQTISFADTTCASDTLLESAAKNSRFVRIKRWAHFTDSLLVRRSAKIHTDTSYVYKPQQAWTFRPKADFYGNDLSIKGISAGRVETSYSMQALLKMTTGVTCSYRGLSLTISVNPRNWFGKKRSTQYCLNYYYNRYGLDITLNDLHDFKVYGGTPQLVRMEGASARLTNVSVNAYWVFNGRKFSLPAAFDQSMIQKRSAGSFLAGASYYMGSATTDIDVTTPTESRINGIRMRHLMASAGYGYNFVPSSPWLVHISATPLLMVWRNDHVRLTEGNDYSEHIKMRFPEGSIIGRMAVVYRWKRYYTGATVFAQTGKVGPSRDFTLRTTTWKSRIFWGVRLDWKNRK